MKKHGLMLLILAATACGARDLLDTDELPPSAEPDRERDAGSRDSEDSATDSGATGSNTSDSGATNSGATGSGVTGRKDAATPTKPNASGRPNVWNEDSVCESVQISTGQARPDMRLDLARCSFQLGSQPSSPSLVRVKLGNEQLVYQDPNGWILNVGNGTLTLQGTACAALSRGSFILLTVEVMCSHPIAF